MKDPIVEEVRRIRKEIETENCNDWDTIEKYIIEKQARRPSQPVAYRPQKLPDRDVV